MRAEMRAKEGVPWEAALAQASSATMSLSHGDRWSPEESLLYEGSQGLRGEVGTGREGRWGPGVRGGRGRV